MRVLIVTVALLWALAREPRRSRPNPSNDAPKRKKEDQKH